MAQGGKVLDRILKAAERELSRVKQAARALRRYMKQRQVSRERQRTMKHEVRPFVREHGHRIEEVERNPADAEKWQKMVFYNSLAHCNLTSGWLAWRDGWKVVAVYLNRADEAGGGRFLAYNILMVQPEDRDYHSLVTLYAAYTLFHSRVVQPFCLGEWPSRRAVCALVAWRPREWTRRRYKALVRVQALWRGWHFRQRVLYLPHTELGRRYLLQAWRRDLEHFVPT
ncbi:g2126 [Coccomyxa elongata]